MQKNNLKSQSIYIQTVIALLVINLINNIVREIPGAVRTYDKFGIFFISFHPES